MSFEVELSMVSTLYRSEPFVDEFCRRAVAAAEKTGQSFEILLVDDGSPDGAAAAAAERVASDERIALIRLSRNFGHHQALMAGIEAARGRRVFLVDSDLEEPPELLERFLAEQDDGAVDVVYGVRKQRDGGLLKRWSGRLFYALFNAFSDTPITADLCTVRLMSRRYVDALSKMRDKRLFLAGNLAWVGFAQRAIPIDCQPRATPSSYTPRKLMALAIDALTSFTSYPLKLIFYLGLALASVAGLAGVALVVKKLLNPAVAAGWSSVMVSIWFLGGVIISFLGLIGIYLAKVFAEVKDRPRYIVREVVRRDTPGGADGAAPR